ncbi:GNAT family N-acetyltransferase [Jidongwangia harbinensis]|uniref:GNAT family N-acetyltransferase n=1 Tax=Jidongwangia harbinensis TaxID=2878561 RepID=UPI001CD94F09|nr:GNAT family protein [Jidongwangia harbinensis]MCA2216451.1 GNAT family N-acetyltransferase [Jidongwangia harbinensis]
MISTRLVTVADAPELAHLLRVHRDLLDRVEPIRDEDFYTPAGQVAAIRGALDGHRRGTTMPHVVVVDGRVAGRITLSNILRGVLQSANIGYWVDPAVHRRGVATAAVREMVRVAFEQARLHRLEAATLLHNAGSQRVLERNGFVRYGVAEQFLKIAGRWQDHVMYQLINPADRVVTATETPA